MKNRPILLIVKGLPYSGKTTFADEWVNAKHNRIRVSWREILCMIGTMNKREKTVIAVNCAINVMVNAMKNGYDVVLDEYNLYPAEFSPFVAKAQLLCKAQVIYKSISTTPDICKERCKISGGNSAELMWIDRLEEKYRLWISQ